MSDTLTFDTVQTTAQTTMTTEDPQTGAEALARDAQAGTLFYAPGASGDTTQWRAETLQVVNWGGFEGRVTFGFHPDTTLISGASGTGKSTLLDAYTALMMDANTPFNGASNDTVRGRARGVEQRNLLTYLRGQTDTTIDETTGHEKAKTLRGNSTATWGAVAMTFVNDRGHRFTALRAFYVPAPAVDQRTITTRMLTFDGRLDLAGLADHVDSRFAPRQLEAAYPGIRHYGSYQAFATALFSRLGIGAHGDGAKALKLLTWIQSGHQIRTVDELFKNMVLETPETYAQADRAIAHFDDLESSYAAMITDQQKVTLLSPITDAWEARERARTEMDILDTFGLTARSDSPLTLWSLQTHRRLLETAVDANRAARKAAENRSGAAEKKVLDLEGELATAQAQHLQAGGATLSALEAQISRDELELEQRRNARSTLEGKIVALGVPLQDETTFTRLREGGDTFTATLPQQKQQLDEAWKAAGLKQVRLLDERRQLQADRTSFAGREGRVDSALNEARDAMARAAGLTREQVPFVAELIDVDPEHEQWRTAAEAVLAGAARTILVPAEHLEHFSRSIDSHRITRRVTFEGVRSAPHRESLGAGDDPHQLIGKLRFKESPYSAWVHEYLSAPTRNPLCIHDPAQLGAGGHRVLPSGQTRSGRTRGSHGINTGSRVIGFSSAAALQEIDEDLAKIAEQLKPVEEELAEIQRGRGALEAREKAYETLSNYTWTQVDVAGHQAQIAKARGRIAHILEADDTLRALAAHIEHLQRLTKDARDDAAEERATLRSLKREHDTLVDEQDSVSNQLDEIDDRGEVILTNVQSERLDQQFAEACQPDDPADLSRFAENQVRLRNSLMAGLDRAREDLRKHTQHIENVFAAYQLKWHDPNVGQSITSYRDYAKILQDIIDTGLHAKREKWRARLAQWSGEDLVPLAQSMESAIKDIEDRMRPVNHILSTLPFGPTGDRLSIHLRRLHPEHVTKFRKHLKVLSGTATLELGEAEMEKRFRQLQKFIAQLRDADDPRAVKGVSDRHRLLDVRRHVDITAERHDVDARLLATLRSLGGKSGGESQELVAFIVGAALRFRLGDEENARPTFAPVFLDEGFVKSDARHTGRAVQAWKGLGFQLIVGAPLDKVSGLEPHMEHFLAITKNQATGYSFVHTVRDRASTDEMASTFPTPAAPTPGTVP